MNRVNPMLRHQLQITCGPKVDLVLSKKGIEAWSLVRRINLFFFLCNCLFLPPFSPFTSPFLTLPKLSLVRVKFNPIYILSFIPCDQQLNIHQVAKCFTLLFNGFCFKSKCFLSSDTNIFSPMGPKCFW